MTAKVKHSFLSYLSTLLISLVNKETDSRGGIIFCYGFGEGLVKY